MLSLCGPPPKSKEGRDRALGSRVVQNGWVTETFVHVTSWCLFGACFECFVLTWHTKWNVSHHHGTDFTCPSRKQPIDNVWRRWATFIKKNKQTFFSSLLQQANQISLLPVERVASGAALAIGSSACTSATWQWWCALNLSLCCPVLTKLSKLRHLG